MLVSESWSINGVARELGLVPETLRQAICRREVDHELDAEGSVRLTRAAVQAWIDDAPNRKRGPKAKTTE